MFKSLSSKARHSFFQFKIQSYRKKIDLSTTKSGIKLYEYDESRTDSVQSQCGSSFGLGGGGELKSS